MLIVITVFLFGTVVNLEARSLDFSLENIEYQDELLNKWKNKTTSEHEKPAEELLLVALSSTTASPESTPITDNDFNTMMEQQIIDEKKLNQTVSKLVALSSTTASPESTPIIDNDFNTMMEQQIIDEKKLNETKAISEILEKLEKFSPSIFSNIDEIQGPEFSMGCTKMEEKVPRTYHKSHVTPHVKKTIHKQTYTLTEEETIVTEE